MSLPPIAWERVATHLGAEDRARLEMVCRATRRACRSAILTTVFVVKPSPTYETLSSFARWLRLRLRHLEEFTLATDLSAWSLAWRFVRTRIALKLVRVCLIHTESNNAVLASPEDVLPISPIVESLEITARSPIVYGPGFSRLPLRSLRLVTCNSVFSDWLSWTMPTLERLCVCGTVLPFSCHGLRYSRVKHLECSASNVYEFLPVLPGLESLIVNGTPPVRFDAPQSVPETLRHVRFTSGLWAHIDWLPAGVDTIECISCWTFELAPGTDVSGIKTLLIIASPISTTLANMISKMNLDHFTYESFGLPAHPVCIRSRSTSIPQHDLCYFDL